jgi:hypothetical protein
MKMKMSKIKRTFLVLYGAFLLVCMIIGAFAVFSFLLESAGVPKDVAEPLSGVLAFISIFYQLFLATKNI